MTDTRLPVCLPGTRSPDLAASRDRESLFAEFQPLVRRLLQQYGDTPELRQDLQGEIYLRFCTLLAAYDPARGVPLRAYLICALTASVFTYVRSQRRQQQRVMPLLAVHELEAAVERCDPTEQWHHDLVLQEILDALPGMIAALPQRQRQVVIWRYYDGLCFEEIAARLGVQRVSARSLVRHGLHRLRRLMADREGVWAE